MLLALIDNKEAAAKVATSYFEMVLPESKMAKLERDAALENQMKEIEEMGPQEMRAVSTQEMMRREQARIDAINAKAGKIPLKPQKTVRLVGADLAKHLNDQVAEKRQHASQEAAAAAAAEERRRARRSPSKRPGQR